MRMIETLSADWTALNTQQQHTAWTDFLVDVETGDATANRWFVILCPLWERGLAPAAAVAEAEDRVSAAVLNEQELDTRFTAAIDAWSEDFGFDRRWAA